MSYVISEKPDTLPLREDRTHFPVVFVAPTGAAIFADTLTEVIEQIIPGYIDFKKATEDEDPFLEARLDSLNIMANQTQGLIVASLEANGKFIVEDLSEDTLTALFTEKDGLILDFEEWTEDIPLILFATNYAPFSDVARPTGESIVWLNAYTELTFLQSLETLGAGELHSRESDLIEA